MALTKKQREIVWQKSEGHCWYCGCDLPEKGWHADHLKPVFRHDSRFFKKDSQEYSGRDTLDNIVPACAPCNLFKSVFSVEEFRTEIYFQADRARKTSVNFRTAERFGIIEVNSNPVVFWYEQQGLTHNP